MGRLYDAARRLSRRILMAIVVDDGDTPAYPDYLSFTSSGDSTIALTNNGGNAPVVYYSFDRETWTLWDYSAISLADGETVYMYGDNGGDGGRFSTSADTYSCFAMTGNLSGGGNVMSLLGEDFENYTAVGSYCFYYLFQNCTGLTQAPAFPATTLAGSCYSYTFYGCTNITSHDFATLNISPRPFHNNSSCASFTIHADTPPTIGSTTITGLKADCVIYVPAASVNAYKAKQYWSARAAYIQANPNT